MSIDWTSTTAAIDPRRKVTKLATMVSGGLGNCSTYALASRRLACSRASTGLG